MHLSFKNLNPTTTKNLLSNFQKLYIFTNGLSIESLLHPMFLFILFLFFRVATYTCICIGRIYMFYRFIGVDKFILYSLSMWNNFS